MFYSACGLMCFSFILSVMMATCHFAEALSTCLAVLTQPAAEQQCYKNIASLLSGYSLCMLEVF